MNQTVPNDGISAYFDEELSPSQREEMARHLSESSAARRELADIRRLSRELRNCPPTPRHTICGPRCKIVWARSNRPNLRQRRLPKRLRDFFPRPHELLSSV